MRLRKQAIGTRNVVGAKVEARRKELGIKQKELLALLKETPYGDGTMYDFFTREDLTKEDLYPMAYDHVCMHEFVMSLEQMKKENGVTAMDIAKALLDGGIHPPTMYFPLIVHEALMVEPTETETKETLDEAVALFRQIHEEALRHPEIMAEKPEKTPIRRPDEVLAARSPVIRYAFED